MIIPKLLNVAEGLPVCTFIRRAGRRDMIFTYILPYIFWAQPAVTDAQNDAQNPSPPSHEGLSYGVF